MPSTDFSDLKALFVNCSLKGGGAPSHTQALMDVSTGVMRANGVTVDVVRAVDHDQGQWIYYGRVGGYPRHRQRGWRQARVDERPLLPVAPRLHDPAAGRQLLAG